MNVKQKLLERLAREPIRVLWVALLAGYVLLVGVQYSLERVNHRGRVEAEMTQAVQRLAVFLSRGKEDEAGSVLSMLTSEPAIEYAALLDGTRSLIVSRGETLSGEVPSSGVRNEARSEFFLTGLRESRPLYHDGQRSGWLYVEANLKAAWMATFTYAMLSGSILVGVLAAALHFMKRRLSRDLEPLGEMAEVFGKVVRTGNYGFRLPRYPGACEQGWLVDQANAILRKVEAQTVELHERRTELAKARRMESIGLLASGVANDLNNILGPLLAFPDMVADRLGKDDAEGRELLAMMRDSASGAALSAQDLLAMANRKAVSLVPLELKPVVLECVEGQGIQCLLESLPGIQLETRLEEGLWVKGSAPHLRRAILNILNNAVEAMRESGGRLFIDALPQTYAEGEAKPDGLKPGDYVLLRIRDMGEGMTRDEQVRMFEPFFTTKEATATASAGLGLAVVEGVAQEHDAVINVVSRKGHGTRVELYFPACMEVGLEAPEDTSGCREPDGSALPRGSERVLIVDDFEVQRRLTERILVQQGYKTRCVPSGREAVELLSREKFDIMVLDMIMEDGFDGLDTFIEVRKTAPDIRCVIMTGLSDSERVDEVLRLGASDCLSKPYTMEDLARAVRKALDEPPAKPREEIAVLG